MERTAVGSTSCTTYVVHNLSTRLTEQHVIDVLDGLGFGGQYTSVLLGRKYEGDRKGFAIVNFVNWEAGLRFARHPAFRVEGPRARKVWDVRPASRQLGNQRSFNLASRASRLRAESAIPISARSRGSSFSQPGFCSIPEGTPHAVGEGPPRAGEPPDLAGGESPRRVPRPPSTPAPGDRAAAFGRARRPNVNVPSVNMPSSMLTEGNLRLADDERRRADAETPGRVPRPPSAPAPGDQTATGGRARRSHVNIPSFMMPSPRLTEENLRLADEERTRANAERRWRAPRTPAAGGRGRRPGHIAPMLTEAGLLGLLGAWQQGRAPDAPLTPATGARRRNNTPRLTAEQLRLVAERLRRVDEAQSDSAPPSFQSERPSFASAREGLMAEPPAREGPSPNEDRPSF